MPTKPLETVIYRELQIARAKKFLACATPLFQELVNYGSNALIRCVSSSNRAENEDLPAMNLYRHILEMTDAFEVLIAGCCASPTVPIVRSSFEALLALDYILSDPNLYVQRSLSWLAAYARKRISMYEMMLVSSERGKEFQASMKKDKWLKAGPLPMPPQDKVQPAIGRLKHLLAREQFATIEAEFASTRGTVPWYALFGGPSNLQQLAYSLDRHVQYDFLYRQWSNVAHAQDFSRFLAVDSTGASGIRGIRDASPLQEISRFAATFMLDATRMMLAEFRPGEEYAKYYKREIQPLFLELLKRDDFFE
jgi:Family of unknown function (DUF5677)